jgi:hypothetical protein
MDEISALDKHIINAVTEAILVLDCLNSDNLYKAECLCCQIWQGFEPTKRPGICKRLKWLVDHDYLPLDPVEIDSDGSMLYRILP